MFSNNVNNNSSVLPEKSSLKNIYEKFQYLLGRGTVTASNETLEGMLSSRASSTEDNFVTPVSSVGDLMAMSPKQNMKSTDLPDVTSDFLTGTDFDSICDITMRENNEELMMDASGFDYLVKCAGSKRQNFVDRSKESLFVKFDPLYATQGLLNLRSVNADSIPDSTECDIGYETGSSMSFCGEVVPPKYSLSTGAIPTSCKEKPMQVVPPVINNGVPKGNANHTRATPMLMRSVSAILTPTRVTTDRLINIPDSTPPKAAPRSPRYSHMSSHEVDRLQSLRTILQRQDQEVIQLRQENSELKCSLRDLEHKAFRSTEDMENKLRKVTEERDSGLERENKLFQQVNEKIMNNKQMCIVMEEYEKTISSLIGEQQQEKIKYEVLLEKLTSEKNEALSHLASMEGSFNDLLSKYEKCKNVIMESKEREKLFELKISEYEDSLKNYEKIYNNLKQATTETLAKANETLESIKKNHSVEITKLNATIKKNEVTISSLQESLTQKTRDNEELTRICDQLINDVH